MALNGLNSALDLGGGNVSNKVKSTTYNNVDIIANNINIKTGNNTDIKGANVLAQATTDNSNNTIGGNINMDMGNNLNIESLQDSYYAKSKNNSWSASVSFSARGEREYNKLLEKNPNASKYNFGIGGGGTSIKSTTDSQWVNEQTSIIGNNNVNIRTNNNTNLTGSVIASNSDNLSLNTNSLTYQDLNDFYTSTTKGNGLTTNIGTSSESFFKGIAPNGTTTITLVNSGEDKKQNTRATIGNGNIIINNHTLTDNKTITQDGTIIVKTEENPGINRDTTTAQETTQDQITGALNGTMQIDNRIFTPDGLVSIYSDVRNVGGNTKKAVIGASRDADLIAKQVYKLPGFGESGLGTQILGTVLGPLTTFGQTRSYLRNKDGRVNQEDIATAGKDYMVLGQASGEKGLENEFKENKDLVGRVNPTDGLIGDTLKSGVMKVFNTVGLDDMIAMNRYVATDLEMRKNNKDSTNYFHSQGTIIGTGAFDILKDKGVRLDNSQKIRADGPAVYKTNWYSEARQVITERKFVAANDSNLGKGGKSTPAGTVLSSNIKYNHNPKDGVRDATAPRSPYYFGKGIINLLINMDQHYMDSYRNK